MGIYESVKISSGIGMKNEEVLKFVLDLLKTKKTGMHAVKNLLIY